MKLSSKLPSGYIISCAQNKEDIIIDAFFPDIKKGLYVDIGANHPDDDSVTRLFYDKGWSGVNVEPNPTLFRLLQKQRKRDINLNAGISSKKTDLVFREYRNHGLSTFSPQTKSEHDSTPYNGTASYHDYKVGVISLNDLAKQYVQEKTIQFMKIDVEGYEYEVVSGNNWDLFRPELVCIEANHIKNDWRPTFEKARYSLVFNDGINEYYLRQESIERLKYFDYARDVVLSGIIINPGTAKRIIDGEEDRFTVLEQDKRIKKLLQENEVLKQRIVEFESNLTNKHYLLNALVRGHREK